MLSLLLSPLIILFLLWLFARHEAEFSYRIVFFVVAGITMLSFVLGFVSIWLALGAYVIGLPFAIARWCYVSLPKAILITVLFIIILVGLEILWEVVFPSPLSTTA